MLIRERKRRTDVARWREKKGSILYRKNKSIHKQGREEGPLPREPAGGAGCGMPGELGSHGKEK